MADPAAASEEPRSKRAHLTIATRDLTPSRTLPAPLTSFVGRQRELAEVLALLCRPDVRLVTLTGPGGVGKTRLALRVAQEWSERAGADVVFVGLATVTDASHVSAAIGRAFGLVDTTDQSLAERLTTVLKREHVLLVLDNFEHVAAAAPILTAMLTATPVLTVLATSRSVLHNSAEHEYPVQPLDLPSPESTEKGPGQSSAVTLFIERARAHLGVIPDDYLSVVGDICRRLDGLPLAIELAAARTRLFTPVELLGRLDHRLPLLTGGPTDAPERLQTMRGAIAWSYDLLDRQNKRLFRTLSVFRGGFTLEAAAAISKAASVDSVVDGVATLLDRSLIQRSKDDGGSARFSMLETIREYGLEELDASGEESQIRAAHAAYFIALGGEAETALQGPHQQRWMDCLDAEHDNLRMALDWCQENDAEAGLQLAGSIAFFWVVRGYYGEARKRLASLLALSPAPTASRAKALCAASLLAREQADLAGGITYGEESLAIYRALGDKKGCATVLRNLGFLIADTGDHHRARTAVEESLALALEVGDQANTAFTVGVLGCLALSTGDHREAVTHLEECAARFHEAGDRRGYAVALGNLGHVLWDDGNEARAKALYDECLTISREIVNKRSIAYTLSWLGNLARSQGDSRQAAAFLTEALSLHSTIGDRLGIAYTISLCGVLAVHQRNHMVGLTLLAAAEHYRPLEPQLTPRERADRDAAVAAARSALGQEASASAWSTGQAMAPEQGVDLAEKMLHQMPKEPSILSPREWEVLYLVAEGKPNRQIADLLFLSHRTVEAHVASILSKLNVGSRHEAISEARARGLLPHD